MTIHIPTMQDDVDMWNSRQPWRDDPPAIVTLGLAEETGELCRAVLKMHQGIRGTDEEWLIEAEKEMGDVFIKLCQVASCLGTDLHKVIEERWTEISKRDWNTDRLGHGIDKG